MKELDEIIERAYLAHLVTSVLLADLRALQKQLSDKEEVDKKARQKAYQKASYEENQGPAGAW